MAKGKYWNGIILGVIAAIAIVYIATTLSWLGFIDDMMISVTTWFMTQTWWPSSIIDANIVKYVFAGIIGALIGLYVEAR